jgi:hypothetical protein
VSFQHREVLFVQPSVKYKTLELLAAKLDSASLSQLLNPVRHPYINIDNFIIALSCQQILMLLQRDVPREKLPNSHMRPIF